MRLKALNTYLLSLVLAFATLAPSYAVNPDEVLSDPKLEQRARNLSTELRCLVCQNQSIDDSDATLAKDLRVVVRERLVEGYSDKQVLDFLVDRYGEFILLKPKFGMHTLALWLLPIFALLAGIFAIRKMFARKSDDDNSPGELNENEQAELDKILKN